VRNRYLGSVLLSILFTTSLMVPLLSFSITSEPALANPTPGVWESKANWPGNVANFAGISCYAENLGVAYVYSLEQDTTSPYIVGSMYRYEIATDTWENLGTAPIQMVTGGMVWTGADNIYIMAGGSNTQNLFYLYTISSNTWTALANTGTGGSSGSGLAWDGGDNIYASIRSSTPANNDLWVYSIAGNTWTDKIALPVSAASGSNLGKVGDNVYFGVGGAQTFWRYNIASNNWAALANVPAAGGNWGAGSGQEKVNENIIYADLGRTTTNFYRFIIPDNRWDIMESLPATVTAAGDRLAFDGTYLYQIRGSTDNQFWRYEVAKYFEKYCMPDLGQHSANWCWVAAAANSIYWYSQHGYPQLIDDPLFPPGNQLYLTLVPAPPPDTDNIYRLFNEIASDCGLGWNQGILDNNYFYGLQKFMNDQGAPLIVHEIVDPTQVSSPPPLSENVIYRPPTLMDYEMNLENCQDVLLWLNFRHHENSQNYEDTDHVVTGVAFNDNTWILVSDPWTTGSPDHNDNFDNKLYDNLKVLSAPDAPLVVMYAGLPEKLSKIVFISPVAAPQVTYGVDVTVLPPTSQSGIPGTTLNYGVQVTNTGNVQDTYTLTASDNASPTWNPNVAPPSITLLGGGSGTATLSVTIPNGAGIGVIDSLTVTATGTGVSDSDTATAQVADYVAKENMPDLGQHCDNWCWVAAAANVFKWYYHNGYPSLMDDPENAVPNDNNYLQFLPPAPTDPLGDNVLRLLHEIAKDCLFPNVAENNENTIPWPVTFCHPIDDNKYFLGLQKFIKDQGASLKVSEIIDNDHFVGQGENIPPENDGVVVYAKPTFDNYKNGLKAGNVLIQIPFRNADYETGNLEALDHILTGVAYYDGGPGNQWILVADSWTPSPNVNLGPDHNSVENRYTYENLAVLSTDPLTVAYTGWSNGNPMPVNVQVVKLIFVSPENVPGPGASVGLVAGWNLVCFTAVGASDTPTNIFTGLTYYTDYYLYWWTAPGGPYSIQDPNTVLLDNIAYWVYINTSTTVSTTGTRPTSRDVYNVAGWNMLGFPVVNSSSTPNNVYAPENYYTDFYHYWWTAPGGPYSIQDPNTALLDNTGYWVWIKENKMVTVP
jgi:hypothetical protein